MKKQKGITLVALIITIIVMVILAGVVIASAVADGGIIDRAQSAMKEKERSEAEELVIASYVYKTTASTSTIAVLNLDATADAIYENLTANGFTLIGASSGDELYTGGNEINLNIQGKQGSYTGTVTDKGLEDNLEVENENNSSGEEKNPTIIMSVTEINKEISSGIPEEVELTAVLNNVIGELIWESSDETIAEITGVENTRKIILKKAGTAIITVSYEEISEICKVTVTEKKSYEEYNAGDEVTLGGESFYVIKDSDSSKSTVEILAKYNLNLEGTAQVNETYTKTDGVFSSKSYWPSFADLNTCEVPSGVTSAVITAKEYGAQKGGNGRLLTYNEAIELKEEYSGIVFGTTIGAFDGSLSYWLGDAYEEGFVYVVIGMVQGIWDQGAATAYGGGVRPVIEIEKDKIN